MFDEAGVACAFEDFPAAVGDVLVERGGHHGGADVAGAAANQTRLCNLVKTVGVFEVGQIAQGLVFVGSPAVEVGFVAGAFRATDTLGRVFVHADDITLIVMLVGAEIVGVVPFPGGFGVADGLLVFCPSWRHGPKRG